MLKKMDVLSKLHQGYAIAVIRGKSKQDAYNIAKYAYKGGIQSLEITFTTPQAEKVIAELVENGSPNMVVGAGTVLDATTARIAIMNGAQYVVSPHFDRDIALLCNRYTIPYLPGCGTVTEIMEALTYGVEVIKLFPGGHLGPSFIKDIKGPIPYVGMMPSGGVNIDNVHEWIARGAFAVGIGSALTKDVMNDDYSSVETTARNFIKKIHSIQKDLQPEL
ncbi:bifunctional 2-keto-4-hydroxyglutarate aldolase/2-keto-3-deoxy-6-phosphogluconate aldolase [Fervidibacillus albus]|uniref:Bifunctional 2-keto-4-hydroxyglutarate aldolase/2-keto-3-deoxy-6-phosphogluconate aldolase n=1 Tax=Fervidibacillus albus TaxID=2980026 RepID=A0A9E8LTK3_9BACI|nr:bifunctional 2-keto-4-hydroxyglutarate aldolase/2-keto-3-deoxy-6-phosphogluconate aldolase [Fervidibacillus albus]WAA09125.1 bifunctional 2-keto-4-hydroxyglutarate aldolase/2-keto-3-deoxy-6-phosphogluconate aldolase [Fervidibacillus albus]